MLIGGGGSKRPPNKEALRLYRDVLKTAKAFYWPNEQGEQWSVVLKRNARKEFEQARYETDPIIIARMLVVGRDCLMDLQNRFNAMEESIKARVTNTRNDRR